MSEPPYCVCRQPYKEDEFMIMCDLCEEWNNGKCIGIQKEDIEEYDCFLCCGHRAPAKGVTYSKRDARKEVKQRMVVATQRGQDLKRQI